MGVGFRVSIGICVGVGIAIDEIHPSFCEGDSDSDSEQALELAAGSVLWPRPEWIGGCWPANRPHAGGGESRRPQGASNEEFEFGWVEDHPASRRAFSHSWATVVS